MGTLELKSNLHKILDEIENEQLLRIIHDFLKQSSNKNEGELWNTLTTAQKKEVYKSYEESNDENKLKSWEDLRNNY